MTRPDRRAEDKNDRTEPPLDAVREAWHDEYDEIAFELPNPEDFES